MSNFNGQPNPLAQNSPHINASGAMLMSGTQNSSLVSGSYSMSSQSSLNVVGQMSLVSSMGQGVYLRQGQITSNNIIMRSPGPSPVLLRSPVPTLTSPLRSPAHYMTPSPSPSIPPSPSPSPSHVSQNFSALGSLEIPTATIVGSNNFPLNIHAGNVNKGKSIKRVVTKSAKPSYQQISCNNVHTVKNVAKTTSPNSQARSSTASPSNHLQVQSSATQPMVQQAFQQVPMQVNASNQLVQIIQGSQIIESRQQMIVPNTTQSQNVLAGTKQKPQQILPKPMNAIQPSASNTQTKVTKANNNGQQTNSQIILPGNINNQPLLLNQMPVLVQQNSTQGVQLILRPPVASNTPGLLIHNARQQPQIHQPQQLLRILNGMQIAAPTFIVSSQQNMQQNISLQHNNQANIAQQQIKSQPVQQPQRQLLNSHIISQNVSSISNTNLQAQLQNIQLNGNLAHIQMPNGLNGQFISQIPAQFQANLAGLSQISTNVNDLQYNNIEIQSSKAASNLSNIITVPTVMQQNVVVSTASVSKVGTMIDSEHSTEGKKVIETEKSAVDVTEVKTTVKTKKAKKSKKTKGKLDLTNLMKLSGIIEDDDMNFLDSSISNITANIANEQQVIVQMAPQATVATQDTDSTYTLKGTDDVPMIIAMPQNQSEENLNCNNPIPSLTSTHSNTKPNKFPCMIMIQNNDSSEPYKISLPNVSSNISESAKDCEASNDDLSIANLPKINETTAMSLAMSASNFTNNSLNSSVGVPTIQSQINEIQNHLMGFSQAASKNSACTKSKSTKFQPIKSPDALEIRNNEIDGINVHANIPSQIGNIQISQVNIPVSVKNSENLINRNVENHIQIMPIVDNSINSSVNKLVNSYITRQMSTQNTFARSDSLIGLSAASDGFVGGLSLTLSEDGRIVLRQDNRSSAPDLQTQVLLRNLISSTSGTSNTNLTLTQTHPVFLSALSNVNNDEFKQKPITNCVNSVTPIATPKANKQPMMENHQIVTSQSQNVLHQRQYFQEAELNKTKPNPVQHSIVSSEYSDNATKALLTPVTKLIELPKIGPNQQLFSLNTATDQITKLNPKLTTLALTPTEQLLIVPAGINAEQLAQCLIQGQIHFNDITGIVSSNNSSAINQTQNIATYDDSTNKEISLSKTDEYKNNNKSTCKSSLHVPSININNRNVQAGNAENMISPKVGVVNNCNPHTNQVPPLANVSVQNVVKSTEALKQNTSSTSMPRLIPLLSDGVTQNSPNFVPRIQTIQLTPQKQQLLKSVQLQIQALSAKLQNKNSLANLCIPVLDTASNTATAIIQPNLSLSDAEIHMELQNLFLEQQKILATGKVIPTIPGQHANFQMPDNNIKPVQAVQSLPLLQAECNLNNANVIKKEIKNNKTSEIKFPKTTEANVTAPSTTAIIQTKTNASQNSIQDNFKNNSNKISNTSYTMQMVVQPSNTMCSTNQKMDQQSSNMRLMKQPINRSSLFEQQLSVDQAGAINPDVHTKFISKSDSCKRLIRYHCLNTPDESESDVSEEIFELRGRHFLNKFQGMINKYQQLLMKQSMRCAPTSELMMIDRMFVAEEQREIERLRKGVTACNIVETAKLKQNLNHDTKESFNRKNTQIYESEKSIDINIIKTEVESSTSDAASYKDTVAVKNENVDSFDIESEIMPSFILKKCEKISKFDNKNEVVSESTDFVAQTQTPIKLIEETKIKEDSKSEPYDEWFCIQKELGYIDEKKSIKKPLDSLDMQMNDIFQYKSNMFYDISNKSASYVENNASAQSKIEDIFKEDSKLFAGMSVETKLEALFSGTNQANIEKVVESCDASLTLQSDRNINKNFLIGSSASSPKRPWNGEVNFPKRQCLIYDDCRKVEPENISTSYQCDNTKRLWNGEVSTTDSKKIKPDNSYQKPKKNILHDLERDLLGLDHIENNLNSNFDEDINAQVQSAIDSILNLQSADTTCQFVMGSESCSLESRDHQASNNKKYQKSQQNVHRTSNLDTGLDEAVKSILKS